LLPKKGQNNRIFGASRHYAMALRLRSILTAL